MKSFDNYVDDLANKSLSKIKHHIEMLYIQGLSKSRASKSKSIELESNLIEKYLTRRGYVVNYVMGVRIYTKAFTCVKINKDSLEVWHDVPDNKRCYIHESLLTGLPITLNYFEKFN